MSLSPSASCPVTHEGCFVILTLGPSWSPSIMSLLYPQYAFALEVFTINMFSTLKTLTTTFTHTCAYVRQPYILCSAIFTVVRMMFDFFLKANSEYVYYFRLCMDCSLICVMCSSHV